MDAMDGPENVLLQDYSRSLFCYHDAFGVLIPSQGEIDDVPTAEADARCQARASVEDHVGHIADIGMLLECFLAIEEVI